MTYVDLDYCNTFLNSIVDGKEWSNFTEEDKQKAVSQACMQIRYLTFKKDYFQSDVPEKIKMATAYQALFILLNIDSNFYNTAWINGWANVNTKDFSANLGSMKIICKPALNLLNGYLLKVGRLK